jgi:hypothetical protein
MLQWQTSKGTWDGERGYQMLQWQTSKGMWDGERGYQTLLFPLFHSVLHLQLIFMLIRTDVHYLTTSHGLHGYHIQVLLFQSSLNQVKWVSFLPWVHWNHPISNKRQSFSRPVSLCKSVFFSPIIILFLQYLHKRSSHVPKI